MLFQVLHNHRLDLCSFPFAGSFRRNTFNSRKAAWQCPADNSQAAEGKLGECGCSVMYIRRGVLNQI